jgi:hypothetical protein
VLGRLKSSNMSLPQFWRSLRPSVTARRKRCAHPRSAIRRS